MSTLDEMLGTPFTRATRHYTAEHDPIIGGDGTIISSFKAP